MIEGVKMNDQRISQLFQVFMVLGFSALPSFPVCNYYLGREQRGTQGTTFTVQAHYLSDQHMVRESESPYIMWRERTVLNFFPLGPLIHLAATSNEPGF